MATPMQEAAQRAAAKAQEWAEKNHADGGVCDFCAHLLVPGEYTTWVAATIMMEMTTADLDTLDSAKLDIVQDPFWAACLTCDPVVQERDPAGLMRHVIANRDVERVGPIPEVVRPIVERDLEALYEKFFASDPTRLEGEQAEALGRLVATLAQRPQG